MYYGIQLATSGALTGLYRTDVLSNNLANLNTVGFKPDYAFTRERDSARVEDGLFNVPSNELLEKLGAGAHMAPNAVDYSQGNLTQTGNPFDFAIRGDGFFVLRSLADGGASEVNLTRDGRFAQDSSGRLVNANTGLPVMSEQNSPIELSITGAISVAADGTISQNGEVVAKLQLVDIQNRDLLKKGGNGVFRVSSQAFGQSIPATGVVEQRMIEESAVNAIEAMMGVQSAAGSVGTNFTMISYQDRMMDRAINTFARIG